MAWANKLIFGLNVLVLALGLWFLGTRGLERPPAGWHYQDLVTILLAAIGVLLAGVTAFVAILALWGYSAVKSEARAAASAVAEEHARNTASEVARAVTLRELPGMVALHFETSGKPTTLASDATPSLEDVLKRGDGNESDAKPD